MGGFKIGLLVGVLATAVVALGVAVVILASDDSDDGTSDHVATRASGEEPTRNESESGEVEDPDAPCLMP